MREDLVLYLRVLAALGMGFIIGWEREIRRQPAGDRTFSLVAAGAAAFTALAAHIFPAGIDKVVAATVTGIGFLGAGLVMRTNANQPRGLTTAAAVWATAAVGVAAGLGHPVFAFALTISIVVVLELRHFPLLRFIDARLYASRFDSDEAGPRPVGADSKGSDSPE
jgi:putative Mg2+ transporter-C (MgtC) family protein